MTASLSNTEPAEPPTFFARFDQPNQGTGAPKLRNKKNPPSAGEGFVLVL